MATCSFTISKIWVILLIDGIHEGLGLLRFIHQTTDCFLYPVPSQTYKSSWAAVIHLDMYLLAVWSSWFVLNILHPGWEKKRQSTISSFTIYWIFTQFEDWEQVTCWFAPCRIWLLLCDMWHVTCHMSHLPIVPPEQSDSLETPAPDVVVPGRGVLHHLPDEVHVAGEVRTSKGPFNSPLLLTDLSINLDPTLPNNL